MFVLVEFLMAVGVVAIVGSLIYTGYKMGKKDSKDD
jgi:Tfp pilus assembly protein PilE